MKRVVTAVLLLFVVLTFCIWAYSFLDSRTTALAQSVSEAENAIRADDFNGAAERMARSYENWDRLAGPFGALVRHNELDEIENLYVRARQAVTNHDANEALLQTGELRAMLLHLTEMEQPSFQNIF